MNGQQKAVETAVAQSERVKKTRDIRFMTMPDAVFVSEGAGIEGLDGADLFQANFEVTSADDADDASVGSILTTDI